MNATFVSFNELSFVFGWIYYTFLIGIAWIALCNYFSAKKKLKHYSVLLFISIFLFGFFATITPDYYSYSSFIEKVRIWILPEDVELFYALLIPKLNYNFYYFRLSIVVPAFCGLLYILKKYSHQFYITLLLFTIFSLLSFSTTIRSSLADIVFYIGALFFFKEKSFRSLVICAILSFICCFLHKSAILLLVPFSLTVIFSNKRIIKIALYCFPLAIILGNMLVGALSSRYLENSIYSSFQTYLSGAVRLSNYVTNIIFLIIIVYTLCINRKLLNEDSKYLTLLFRLVFWGGYIWLILCVIDVSRYLASRFLAHMMIPILLLMSYSIEKRKINYAKTIIIMSLLMICVNEFSTLTKFREYIG